MSKTAKLSETPKRIFGFLAKIGVLNNMSDETFLKIEYYLNLKRKLNLDNPKSFNEKIQWLKINDRAERYVKMVDKNDAKELIADAIGAEYVIPTIGVYDSFDDIDFDKLPNQFAIKCTHDSGGIVICKDKAKFDIDAARKTINKYLKRRYYYIHREWPYKNVKPRVLVEKYMKDNDNDELVDYKVMCFNGVAMLIFTCTERVGDGLKVTFFDLDWNRLPFERHYPVSKKTIKKPKNLKKMIDLSERLSSGLPFVRIDWYEINGKLFFGEYTFYPGAGLEEFTPDKWDDKLGDLIDLGFADKNE